MPMIDEWENQLLNDFIDRRAREFQEEVERRLRGEVPRPFAAKGDEALAQRRVARLQRRGRQGGAAGYAKAEGEPDPEPGGAADALPGGLADNFPDSDFDPEQLVAGTAVEMEHTDDHELAKEIAKDHLREDRDYYRKLRRMEGKGGGVPFVRTVDAAAYETLPERLKTAAADVHPEPSEAQLGAGNWRKGHVTIHGIPLSIEVPRGGTRRGVGPDGKPWSRAVSDHYGYIKGTQGKDKDHIDCYVGPHPETELAFVVDQVRPESGRFDEHKVCLGYRSKKEARAGYLANYPAGWGGLGAITAMTVPQLRSWLKKGDTTRAVAGQVKYQRNGSVPYEGTELAPTAKPEPALKSAGGSAEVPTAKVPHVPMTLPHVGDAAKAEPHVPVPPPEKKPWQEPVDVAALAGHHFKLRRADSINPTYTVHPPAKGLARIFGTSPTHFAKTPHDVFTGTHQPAQVATEKAAHDVLNLIGTPHVPSAAVREAAPGVSQLVLRHIPYPSRGPKTLWDALEADIAAKGTANEDRLKAANHPDDLARMLTGHWLVNAQDRHGGNYIIGPNHELVPIDYGMSFFSHPDTKPIKTKYESLLSLVPRNHPLDKGMLQNIVDKWPEIWEHVEQLATHYGDDAPRMKEAMAKKLGQVKHLLSRPRPTVRDLRPDSKAWEGHG